jgi:hypothetical protein
VSDSRDVRERAIELHEAGLIGEAASPEATRVLEPIPVTEPASGRLHSWFVPVVVGDGLAGFAELLPDLELARYSSFQPGQAETAELPDPADWTDPETIRRRAGRASRPGETLGDPVLTYDRSPARLAWAVPATDPAGQTRTLCVAGEHVYEQPPEPPEPEVGGGPG